MHSASMTLNQTELSNFTGAIVDLLEDPGTLSQSKSAQEALGNIRKVRKHNEHRQTIETINITITHLCNIR